MDSKLSVITTKILNEIRRDTNGAVVDSIRGYVGDSRFLSYGVSLPHIKKIAKSYYPNHSLALHMFNTSVREAKLAAIYIDDPTEVTLEQMSQWSLSFDLPEIADNCATMLFWASKDCLALSTKWLSTSSSSHGQLLSSLMMSGKRAKNAFSIEEFNQYKEVFELTLSNIATLPNRGVTYFLVAVCQQNDFLKSIISDKIRSNSLPQDIIDELSWQLF